MVIFRFLILVVMKSGNRQLSKFFVKLKFELVKKLKVWDSVSYKCCFNELDLLKMRYDILVTSKGERFLTLV